MTDVTDMTDAKNPAPEPLAEIHSELRSWCEAWKKCFEDVLSQVSGQPSTFELSAQALPALASDLCYTVVAGGAAQGETALRLPVVSGRSLARKFLGETEPAAPEDLLSEAIAPEEKEALEELLRQIAGLAATALAPTAGGQLQLHLSASAAPSWPPDTTLCLRSPDDANAGASIAIELQISPVLAAALQSRAQASSGQAASAQPAAMSPPPSPPVSNYGRLMDVGLDVKLRFGTRRMLLRDVLALSAGVVVELDNALHAPVDLLLDGRLIAQGEVVVVDGQYGLRITDVVDPAPGSAAAL